MDVIIGQFFLLSLSLVALVAIFSLIFHFDEWFFFDHKSPDTRFYWGRYEDVDVDAAPPPVSQEVSASAQGRCRQRMSRFSHSNHKG